MSLQERETRLLGIEPTNWLRVMLETENPLIDKIITATTFRSSSCYTVDFRTR